MRPTRGTAPAKPSESRVTHTSLELITAQLRQARRARRLTQETLAGGLDVSALAIGCWESGKDTAALGNFVRWAEALDHTVTVTGSPGGDVLVPRRGEPLDQFRIRCLTAALANARRAADRTQEMVGDAVAVSGWTVHMWETAHRFPRLPHLIAWCAALRCELVLVERRR